MSKQYFYGYLYIKLVRLFAILVGLCGIGVIAFTIFQYFIAVDRASYKPNPSIETQITKLNSKYKSTKAIILQSRKQTALPQKYESLITYLECNKNYKSSKQLKILEGKVIPFNDSIDVLKKYLVESFDESANRIKDKLKEHAASLRAQNKPKESTRRSTTPPIVNKAEPDNYSISYTPNPSIFNINKNEINDRRNGLGKSLEYFEKLLSQSASESSKNDLNNIIDQINSFTKLFPEDRELKPNTVYKEQKTTYSQEITIEDKTYEAEILARMLSSLQDAIKQSVLNDWDVEKLYESLLATINTEFNRAADCESEINGLTLKLAFNIIQYLIASLVLAFVLMVIADLIQAHFDTASNTKSLVDLNSK